ncbi:MAG: DUF1343 domain-containing protein [Ignavibacteria bacterium]|jgi:uncharacterized protein YbbC (DUF1343 family)
MKQLIFTLLLLTVSFSQSPKVKTGIEVLKENGFVQLDNKTIGLITNQTGVDNKLISTVDIFYNSGKVNLKALFAPEHGVRGTQNAGSYVKSYIDKKTQLPVYSLYGKTKEPTQEMLEGIDVLVYDLQDIGSRSYTYISTLGLAMEAAAENNIEFIVLDRPNPLGGLRVEGSLVEDGFHSFVSKYEIPYIYGLTCGELASFIKDEIYKTSGNECRLTVIKMEGWEREMLWLDTGLHWIPTSPHIPNWETAFYYSATGIVGELNKFSNGVGYTIPFQTIAAEFINPDSLAEILNSKEISEIIFKAISYKPYYAFSKDKTVNGVQIYFEDFSSCMLTEIQFYVLEAVHELYPDKLIFEDIDKNSLSMFDKVLGSDKIRLMFQQNYKVKDIREYWRKDVEKFKELSKEYYLYN